jgi:hypothetical protein
MERSSYVPLSDVQGTFTRLGKLVDYWGGMTRQFVVDDKGCILIVCFGAPGFSHVSDSEREVMLGFSVKRSLSGSSLSHIGINQHREGLLWHCGQPPAPRVCYGGRCHHLRASSRPRLLA